jgi:hypothetical protein
VLPTVLASIGLAADEVPESLRGEGVLPLAQAVHEAARHPGASVEPVGAPPGERSRFALLRRRRHQPQAEVTGPAAQEVPGPENPEPEDPDAAGPPDRTVEGGADTEGAHPDRGVTDDAASAGAAE